MSEAKLKLFEEFARIGAAVASPGRLLLLDLLAQGEKPVELLAAQSEMAVKNTSAHLKKLKQARLIESRRAGTYVWYRLADPEVFDFLRALQALGTMRLPEVEQLVRDFYESPYDLDVLDSAQLLSRVRSGEVVLIDVRPVDEYRAGHIPGAVSIPIETLERRIDEVGVDAEIVAYCRGPYCMFAVQAIQLLRTRGYRAHRLATGLADWRAAGNPVATLRA